jgi:RNA polymerase sigma factor (sigma-70 family)
MPYQFEARKKVPDYLNLDDRLLVNLILEGDHDVAANFLKQKCTVIFDYIIKTRLKGLNLNIDDLVSDFYIFLQENDWEKLRQFRFESKLLTWINLVASRYFLKKYASELKESARKCTPIDGIPSFTDEDSDRRIVQSELLEAISAMKQIRYQQVLLLGLQGFDSGEIGEQLGISINNVYIIRSRAITNLKSLLNG